MKGRHMRATIAFAQTPRHRPDNFPMLIAGDVAITAENPNQSGIPVTPSQPFAINFGVGDCKKRFARFALVAPKAAPRREKANVKAALVCLSHNEIDMVPVIILR